MIVLVTNQYTDPDCKRQEELDYCLARNTALLMKIGGTSVQIGCRDGARPTFDDIFQHSSLRRFGREDVVVVANADIYFNETLALLNDRDLAGVFISLAKVSVDWDGKPTAWQQKPEHSQDAWAYVPPIPRLGAAFTMGVLACEYRLCFLAQQARLTCINPWREICAFHLHTSLVRHYDIKGQWLPAPYMNVGDGSIHSLPKRRQEPGERW